MIIIQVFPKLNMSIPGLVSTKLNWTMDNQHSYLRPWVINYR